MKASVPAPCPQVPDLPAVPAQLPDSVLRVHLPEDSDSVLRELLPEHPHPADSAPVDSVLPAVASQ